VEVAFKVEWPFQVHPVTGILGTTEFIYLSGRVDKEGKLLLLKGTIRMGLRGRSRSIRATKSRGISSRALLGHLISWAPGCAPASPGKVYGPSRPKTVFDEGTNGMECGICCELFESTHLPCILPCGHVCCTHCAVRCMHLPNGRRSRNGQFRRDRDKVPSGRCPFCRHAMSCQDIYLPDKHEGAVLNM
jgi:hypothetical protein